MGSKFLFLFFSLLIPFIAFFIKQYCFNHHENENKVVPTPKKKTLLEEMYENDFYKEHREVYENCQINLIVDMKLNSSISKLYESDDYIRLEENVIKLIEEIKVRSQSIQSIRSSFHTKRNFQTSFDQKDIRYIKHIISEST